ncbi:hypothetical protein BBJ28_00016345 [Nothophytophthora sp. Chile5]|nr:hypothetical protein BBJ28_00016345 [Nothophytophthora sp. Chile5]
MYAPMFAVAMSDFTDDEDRQLVQLALVFLRRGRQVVWEQLTRQMRATKQPKEALRQRLKTLKRTYGRNLERFPPWFFKEPFSNAVPTQCLRVPRRPNARATAVYGMAKASGATKLGAKQLRGRGGGWNVQKGGRFALDGTSNKTITCSYDPVKPQPVESVTPASPLLLLASVATTTDCIEKRPASCHAGAGEPAWQASDSIAMKSAKSDPDVNGEAFDSTAWPINRLSYDELGVQDSTVIEKLFASRSDTPLLMKWVLLHKPGGKFRPRFVVISALRVWLLKQKKAFSRTLERRYEYQLMHVQKLNVLRSSTSTISIKLVFESKQANGHCEEPITLHFDPGVHTESFVRLFQRLLHSLRLVFPHKQVPTVSMPSNCHWHEFFPAEASSSVQQHGNQDESPANSYQNAVFPAMTMAYRAFCDDLGVRFRASVTSRLEECATNSENILDFQYCLGFPPGVDGYEQHQTQLPTSFHVNARSIGDMWFASKRSATWFQALEVQALARMLTNSSCFSDIGIRDLKMGHVSLSALFQALVSPFCSIAGFTLTNVQLSVRALRLLQHVVLQSTIQRSPGQRPLALRRLDLSFNCFSTVMATELATTLELLPTGLELLQLERCGLSTVSCCRIVQALKTNTAFAASLLDLNMAGNQLGSAGTRALSTWLTSAFALQRLDLSRTQLDMNTFVQALKQNVLLHESSLLQLDLSYNQMRTQASQDLGVILGKSQSLATLFLRGMRRYRRFQSLLPQQFQQETTLVALSEAAVVAARRRNGKPVHRADGLRKQFLRNILKPMFANSERSWACMVDLSENDLSGHRAELLAQLLDDSPWATRTPIEQAGANALALLLGGIPDSSDNQPQDGLPGLRRSDGSAPFPSFPSIVKPLKLKELCLKCEGSYVFGSHIVTAAVQALGRPHSYLQMLDVTGNECGDALANVLGDVLPSNRSLQALFWDGNCVTVDGFFRFYEGLLQNHTLVMVQMPIQDTRRILEEQKDPPREKLFSILGKIFKATERNQILVKQEKERKAQHRSSRSKLKATLATAADSSVGCQLEDDKPQSAHPTDVSIVQEAELEASAPKLERCPSPDLSSLSKDPASTLETDASVRKSCSRTSSVRYPSTMQSWSMRSGEDDFRAQLSQLDSLTASFSFTPSHM